MSNPYLTQNQQPALRPSIFCFLDVLGYSEFSALTLAAEELAARLEELHGALTRSSAILIDADRQTWHREATGADDAAIKAFTDNIVIGLPFLDDGEMETGIAFERIGAFQLEMALAGFFVRGAISVGPVFIDDLAVFGPPLIEAAKAEAGQAHVPRVILTATGRALVETHMAYYGNGDHAPQNIDLKRDSDGSWFVDYLISLISDPDSDAVDVVRLRQHRDVVREKLGQYADSPKIWEKYEWSARYHNWFCEQWGVPQDCLIEIDGVREPIREIVVDLEQAQPMNFEKVIDGVATEGLRYFTGAPKAVGPLG